MIDFVFIFKFLAMHFMGSGIVQITQVLDKYINSILFTNLNESNLMCFNLGNPDWSK